MRATRLLFVLGLFCFLPLANASAQAPALSPISDITLNADGSATINIVAIDEDGGQLTLSAALPSFATLDSPTIGIGEVVTTLTVSPQDIHVGSYNAAVTATAGGVTDTELLEITVNPAGSALPPIVAAPPIQQVEAGTSIWLMVSASDPDGTGIESLGGQPLPPGATFFPNSTNTSGAFSWTPNLSDVGEYDVVFTATGVNQLRGGAVTHIRITPAPQLGIEPIFDVTIEGGSSTSVAVNASGLPGAMIGLTASLPSFATLDPPGSGTGSVNTTITISPPVGSAGTYNASVTAASEGEFVTELFDIIVTGEGGGENNPPVLSAPMLQMVDVGATLIFDVTAVDADGDDVDLVGTALPPGASFMDNGDNSGTFSWTPVSNQTGTHTASFSGLDGRGGTGSASTTILVSDEPVENQPPTLSAPATAQVDEGMELSFQVTATDPDGDPVAISADNMPPGAMFSDQGDNTALFSWTPDMTQSGEYEVSFTGDDGQGGSGTASTMITVVDVDIPGSCMITGDTRICEGSSTELCGPDGAESYSWTGPNGFVADTQCIDVAIAGSYELTVMDSDGHTDLCSETVMMINCDTVQNCPRGLLFWKCQCKDWGRQNVKFTREQMDEITGCIDARSDYFDWDDDREGFCAVLHPRGWKNVRERAKRMYAVLLANVCAGELGVVASDGKPVSLDPSTEINCDYVDGVETIADLMAAAEMRFAELEDSPMTPSVWWAYFRLKLCMARINYGIGIGPTCTEEVDTVVAGAACLDGRFKPWRDQTCFRVKPVQDSFDPRDVVLSSVTLHYDGQSIAAPSDEVELDYSCSCRCRHGHHDKTGDRHDDDDDDDDESCGVSCDDRHDDRCRHRHDDDDNDKHGGRHDRDRDRHHDNCELTGIRACFSTDALMDLFEGADLPCDLEGAEIHAMLSNGATLVSTFNGQDPRDDDEDGEGDDDSGGDGEDSDGESDDRPTEPEVAQSQKSNGLTAEATPNPFNPMTELAFTISRTGRVRVMIYDVQGRLVKTLLDEVRTIGEQRVIWNGLNSSNQTVSSGVYFALIQAPEGRVTKKLTVVK